jgi:hypothetical protein
MNINLTQYRSLRRIYLRTARAYRLGSVWGPAEPTKLRDEQKRLAALRVAVRA